MQFLASSPITTWEGAGAFFPYADSGLAILWFWVSVILCIAPLVVSYRAEKQAEREHSS